MPGYRDENVAVLESIDQFLTMPVFDDFWLKKFSNLRKISVRNLEIKEVSEAAFIECGNLEEVAMTSCGLLSLPVGLFRNCLKLKYLKLDKNKIEEISGIFKGLESLEVLNMDGNELKVVNIEDLVQLTGIKELILSNNKITSFKAENLVNLQQLDLSRNFLVEIEFGIFPKLDILKLQRNQLKILRFLNPLTLTSLDLSESHLKNLSLKNVKYLKNLNLNGNSGIFGFEFLKDLTDLEVLSMETCGIDHLTGLFNLKNLKTLNLGHNQIHKLQLPFLPMLETLTLNSNKISFNWSDFFKNCTSLKHLDMSHNFIQHMEPVKQLKTLKLTENKIKILEISDFFDSLETLEELEVDNNEIYAIETNFLVKFKKLVKFSSAGNACVKKNAQSIEFSSEFLLKSCYENYEKLTMEGIATTTEAAELNFTGADLLITIICIIFVAILLILFVYFVDRMLGIWGGSGENGKVFGQVEGPGVNYEKF